MINLFSSHALRNGAFLYALIVLLSISFTPEFASASTSQPAGHDEHGGSVHGNSDGAGEMAKELPLWSGLPFIGILLSIALFPLVAPHFWHKYFPVITAFWAIVFAVPFILSYNHLAVYEILHIYLADYVPFLVLLWGLYIVAGGIWIGGSLVGTPLKNTQMLAIGAFLASWMGTTGASMLMIRPILRANQFRKYKVHIIVFFIFLVSNVGGALTPLGDPPLFLGFLHGVPFFWTFNLFPHYLLIGVILLGIFYLLDVHMMKKEDAQVPHSRQQEQVKYPLRVEGVHNFLFLAGILAAVLYSGSVKLEDVNILGVHIAKQNLIRDGVIFLLGVVSLLTTHHTIRGPEKNQFSWFPIKEVAILFAGIFMTIIPMLAMLKAGSEGALRSIVELVEEPHHYFWITGLLSGFLDNAPTYLTFFNMSLGRLGISEADVTEILNGIVQGRETLAMLFVRDLEAISVGAVFFGALTYIGNAPNFMVRSIASEGGVKMPSFFGYMMWSVGILVPLFLVVTLIFFL